MKIIIGKAKTTKKTFATWFASFTVILVLLIIFNWVFYYIFAASKKTLVEHFTNNWFFIVFYSLIFPASIAFSYRQKQLTVEHSGEVDPLLIKNYFESRNYRTISETPGKIVMQPAKLVERFLTGAMSVTIIYTENTVSIKVPERMVYDVHHGFKFANLFLKQS